MTRPGDRKLNPLIAASRLGGTPASVNGGQIGGGGGNVGYDTTWARSVLTPAASRVKPLLHVDPADLTANQALRTAGTEAQFNAFYDAVKTFGDRLVSGDRTAATAYDSESFQRIAEQAIEICLYLWKMRGGQPYLDRAKKELMWMCGLSNDGAATPIVSGAGYWPDWRPALVDGLFSGMLWASHAAAAAAVAYEWLVSTGDLNATEQAAVRAAISTRFLNYYQYDYVQGNSFLWYRFNVSGPSSDSNWAPVVNGNAGVAIVALAPFLSNAAALLQAAGEMCSFWVLTQEGGAGREPSGYIAYGLYHVTKLMATIKSVTGGAVVELPTSTRALARGIAEYLSYQQGGATLRCNTHGDCGEILDDETLSRMYWGRDSRPDLLQAARIQSNLSIGSLPGSPQFALCQAALGWWTTSSGTASYYALTRSKYFANSQEINLGLNWTDGTFAWLRGGDTSWHHAGYDLGQIVIQLEGVASNYPDPYSSAGFKPIAYYTTMMFGATGATPDTPSQTGTAVVEVGNTDVGAAAPYGTVNASASGFASTTVWRRRLAQYDALTFVCSDTWTSTRGAWRWNWVTSGATSVSAMGTSVLSYTKGGKSIRLTASAGVWVDGGANGNGTHAYYITGATSGAAQSIDVVIQAVEVGTPSAATVLGATTAMPAPTA